MSNSPNTPSEPPNNRRQMFRRLLQMARRPSALTFGVSSLLLGVAGYVGVRFFVYQKLPSLLEAELSEIFNREVRVGQVQSFSFNSIRLGPSSIPPTPTDPDRASAESVEVGFNLLPVLVRRPLPLSITLVEVDAHAAQEEKGKWVNLDDIEFPPPPIPIDTTIRLSNGKLALLPHSQTTPLKVQLDGAVQFFDDETQPLKYEATAAIADGLVKIQGETLLKTDQTEVQLIVKNLVLAELAFLIPNSPVEINGGELNANLNIELPSFQELTSTRVQGTASLSEIEVQAQQLTQPVKASAAVSFHGTKIQVEEAKGSLGELAALVGGEVDWSKGFDLNVIVKPFSLANFLETVSVSSPVEVDGQIQAELRLTGSVEKPVLRGTISSRKKTRIDKIEFERISTEFSADLEKFVLKNFQALPAAGGQIKGGGTVETGLRQYLEEKQPIDLTKMPLKFDFQAKLPTEEIAAPYYRLPPQVQVGTITAQGQVRGTLENPRASLKWEAPAAEAASVGDISGAGEVLLVGDNLLVRNTGLQIDRGTVALNGSGNLDTQKWQASLVAKSISLDPFLSQIYPDRSAAIEPITLENANLRLLGRFDALDPEAIQGAANLTLSVDGGRVALSSQLNSGILEANATASQIPVAKYLPNLSVPVTLVGARVDFSGKLEQLLSLGATPDLSSFTAGASGQLAVADGTVKVTGQLNSGQWQTKITASNLDTSLFPGAQDLALPDLNAKLNLSGNLDPLFNPNIPATIAANTVSVQLGEQSLNARGNLVVSNRLLAPEIASLNLDVEARSDLGALPFTQLISLVPADSQFLPEKLDLTGKANFKGRLEGKNLLGAPLAPGNLDLTGNLRLLNFTLNDVAFEPSIAGPVKIAPGEKLAIDLRGTKEIVAAVFEPCTQQRCPLPYLPASLELRQGEGRENPIMVTGKRIGDRLVADIQNFPLGLLNIAPATAIGIEGSLKGEVNANLDLNLFTFATTGNLQISQPAIGYIQAEEFASSFAYDSDNNLARLISASLEFGQSRSELQGSLNLNSGELDGKLNISRGYVQDILTTFRWFRVEDLARLLETPDYTAAAEVPSHSVGDPDASLAYQLNLLWRIEKQIRELAARRQAGGVPTELDIRGAYTGEITLAGTLNAPEVNFKVQGSNWQWHPQSAFPAIVKPLGLVKEEPQVISVERVLAQGSIEGGAIKLEPLRVELGETVLAVTGKLSAEQESASFAVENLSLDTVSNFVQLPVDIGGKIDVKGSLGGSLANLQVKGEIAFTDGAVNGRSLDENILGSFSYADSRLEFRTTSPESLQVYASVPYPTEPDGDNQLKVDVKLGTEAIAWVNLLTQGQVEWIDGEGEVTLNASGRLDLSEQMLLRDLAVRGEIALFDATLKSAAFPEPLNVNGQIALNNQLLKVEQLEGKFADSKLSLTGVLPIFQPLSPSDPDSSNPLTVVIEQGQIGLEGLYQGEMDGQVVVKGAVLSPVIGGEVRLANGRVFVPKGGSRDAVASPTLADRWTGTVNRKDNAAAVPKLDNFRVVLEGLKVAQDPLYKFRFGGALTLNGPLDNLNKVQPEGTIQLERGQVTYAIGSEKLTTGTQLLTPDTEFVLNRRHRNEIVFKPKQGLLNPDLDIQMRTLVSELPRNKRERLESQANEIPDDPLNRVQRIDILLSIKGQVSQLLPSLGSQASQACQIRSDTSQPIPEKRGFSSEELQKLATCLQAAVFEGEASEDGSDFQLPTPSVVKLTSNPKRSESEIIRLLGERIFVLAETLQNSSEGQLLNSGVIQLFVPALAQSLLYDVENAVSNALGLADFRFFPIVEMTSKVGDESFVKLSYDYNPDFNEFKVRYEVRF